MSVPPDPGHTGFLSSERSGPAPAWHWLLLDQDGAEARTSLPAQRFGSQADAETWVGEKWRDLADAGVESVVLMEGDRKVYGPMSLRA